MAVAALPPIFRTPGAQDDYPFTILKSNGDAKDITNDLIEIVVGDETQGSILSVNSNSSTDVEKDDPTNGGITLHISPDFNPQLSSKNTKYSIRMTPNATAPSSATVVTGDGDFTFKETLFILPQFEIDPQQAAVSVVAGNNVSITTLIKSLGKFADSVVMAVAVNPVVVDGPSASIGSPAVVPSEGQVSKSLDLGTVLATPLGSYVVTVTGTVGQMTRTATVVLTVT